ncbi:hypothetical protein [Blastococcus sp. TF02A-30]|uniref:hypothetical protein n=1 Tax=Blastococcus sp. TF02A-30 TaxID=2250580 RepID=UPI000DEB600A|nr:hypothetical protein [Blastococcus sp. TF02A-30]RBY85033.1 hypothetical protein DQ241_17220 [Blastococcus sp. TF02A-30]
MSYDALAESLRLLDGAPPAADARLSRRVRHLPLAVDRVDDVAATMFLRRGVNGAPEIDVHVLERVDGRWVLLGGGGGPGEEAVRPRPALAALGGPAVSSGGGSTARRHSGWWPRIRDSSVHHAEVFAAREVAALRVDDRVVPVAAHGCAVVVWTRRAPAITALDRDGEELGTVVPLRLDQCAMPPWY